jgi:site-specific DNA-methyltransferase (adenine-specific)
LGRGEGEKGTWTWGLLAQKEKALKPYYQDDAVTIYHGDCREIIGGLQPVDLVVTDPPYGMEFQSNRRIVKHKKIANDEALDVDLIQKLISMSTRAAYVFCRWDNLQAMPKPKSVLAWVKNNWSMGDLKHEHGRQWEACCFYPQAGHEFIKRIPDVIHADKTGNEQHPTEKPVTLLAQIIASNVGVEILDPFMGSGTTLRAAKNLGRRAIGIELEEKYCEIAARRMSQEVLAL